MAGPVSGDSWVVTLATGGRLQRAILDLVAKHWKQRMACRGWCRRGAEESSIDGGHVANRIAMVARDQEQYIPGSRNSHQRHASYSTARPLLRLYRSAAWCVLQNM